jgi:hypothetical protein
VRCPSRNRARTLRFTDSRIAHDTQARSLLLAARGRSLILILDILGEQMTKFLRLDLQVALVLYGDARDEWNALLDNNTRRFDCQHFLWIVGEQTKSPHSKFQQHFGRRSVVPGVHGQAKGSIRTDRIMMSVLQSVGTYLVEEANPATFLSAQVDQNPRARLDNPPQRFIELGAAVTAQRPQCLAGYTLRMDSHEWRACLAEP